MNILAPGLYALLPLSEDDEDDDGSVLWPLNFADETNRKAAPLHSETAPAGAFLLETDACYTGHSIDTPFGPLNSSDLYAVMPVDSDETNFLPNIQNAYNWIVLDIAVPTAISASGTAITVGDVTFDVEDTESVEDLPGYYPPCPEHTLADVGFSVVDDDLIEVAYFTAADPEYGAFTFLFEKPRLDYDLQHIVIDDEDRAKLEKLGTPVARALLNAWVTRRNPPHMCIVLRKAAPAPRLAKAA